MADYLKFTRPYWVSYDAATPDEVGPGWFFGVEWSVDGEEYQDVICGPYMTCKNAQDAIFDFDETDFDETEEAS